MRIALFSDIHGNLPALQAVFEDIVSHQPDVMYCLGDLVNFAPWTNETVDFLRYRTISVVQGNHDKAIGLHQESFKFSFHNETEKEAGLQAIAVTNAVITDDNRAYLNSLPQTISIDFVKDEQKIRMVLTHASPTDINRYIQYEYPEKDILSIMDNVGADILIMGHTHKPYHKLLDVGSADEKLYKHVINVGSVGKPKDGNSNPCWCLVELDNHSNVSAPESIKVDICRTRYDIGRTIMAIEESRIPNIYAQLLQQAK